MRYKTQIKRSSLHMPGMKLSLTLSSLVPYLTFCITQQHSWWTMFGMIVPRSWGGRSPALPSTCSVMIFYALPWNHSWISSLIPEVTLILTVRLAQQEMGTCSSGTRTLWNHCRVSCPPHVCNAQVKMAQALRANPWQMNSIEQHRALTSFSAHHKRAALMYMPHSNNPELDLCSNDL